MLFSVCLRGAVVPTAGSLHEAASHTESTASTFFFLSSFFFYSRLFFSVFFIFSERDEQGVRNGGVGSEDVCVYQAAS